MLFTADHDEPRRALQRFIAAEINPHVDEWEKADIFPAHELFKKLGDLASSASTSRSSSAARGWIIPMR